MVSCLPPELLCSIAENLIDDRPSLQYFAQTCRQALDPCRQVLLRNVKLTEGMAISVGQKTQCDRIHEIIEANPHLAVCIHSLSITNPERVWSLIPWSKTLPSLLNHIANAGGLRVFTIFTQANQWDRCPDKLQAAFIHLLRSSSLLQTLRMDYFCAVDAVLNLIPDAATSPHIADIGIIQYPQVVDEFDIDEDDSTDEEEGDDETDGNTDDEVAYTHGSSTDIDVHDITQSTQPRLLNTLKIGPSSLPLVDWILSPRSEMSVANLKTLIIDGGEGESRAAATKIIPICANTIERLAWIQPLMEDGDIPHPVGGINLRELHQVREMTVYFTIDYEGLVRGTFEGAGFPPQLEHLVFVVEPGNATSEHVFSDWEAFDEEIVGQLSGLERLKSIKVVFFAPPKYFGTEIPIEGILRHYLEDLYATGKFVAEVVQNGQPYHRDSSAVQASISFSGRMI